MLGAKSLLTGLALGAGAMYFCDASQGARRRKLLADQCNHLLHACLHDFDVAWRDLKNRSQGVAAGARRLADFSEVPDELIVERVRAQLGHDASHARDIEVQAQQGHVVLRGSVSPDELFGLLRGIGAVSGVRTVADELTLASHGGNGSSRPNRLAGPQGMIDGSLAPSTKLLVGGTGAFLLANCLAARRRTLIDVALGTLGFGMLARSLTLSSQGGASNWQRVEFHKTLTIHAPIEKVFGFLTHPENWPSITNRIRNLRWLSDDAFAKDIALPGMNLYCSERIACVQENECFITDSLPDSWLAYRKELHFEPVDENTRLHLKFSYSPPAGAVGHAAASIFGLDAKSFFDDFLMRAKNYLETGLQPHDVARFHSRYGRVDAGPNVPPHEGGPQERDPEFRAESGPSMLIE